MRQVSAKYCFFSLPLVILCTQRKFASFVQGYTYCRNTTYFPRQSRLWCPFWSESVSVWDRSHAIQLVKLVSRFFVIFGDAFQRSLLQYLLYESEVSMWLYLSVSFRWTYSEFVSAHWPSLWMPSLAVWSIWQQIALPIGRLFALCFGLIAHRWFRRRNYICQLIIDTEEIAVRKYVIIVVDCQYTVTVTRLGHALEPLTTSKNSL